MTNKIKIIVLSIFLCCALVGVGFADWAITQIEPMTDLKVGIKSDEIFYSSNYISLEGEPQTFVYTYRGFRDEEDNISYHGEVVANYKIDLVQCRTLYGTSENVIAELTLGLVKKPHSDNVFKGGNFVSAQIMCDIDSVISHESDYQNAKDGIFYVDLNVDLSTNDEAVTITVTYNFDFRSYEEYSKYIYDEFNRSGQMLAFNGKLFERS